MAQESTISIIAAVGRNNRAIGKDKELLWRLPEDLKRFKQLTLGHPVIMGRKTWQSLPASVRPLPGRTNIIVTRFEDYPSEGALLATTFPGALSLAKDCEGSDEIFIIGGGQLYEAALPFASRIYLTLVESDAEGDTRFPAYEEEFSKVLSTEEKEFEGLRYTYLTLERP
ncbi:dihydrofolate reductase [Patescibacteria group bacterium]|nr:dihydrofolate reductase [Patescibacteria group bacterium]